MQGMRKLEPLLKKSEKYIQRGSLETVLQKKPYEYLHEKLYLLTIIFNLTIADGIINKLSMSQTLILVS